MNRLLKKHDHNDLEALYRDAEDCDKEAFARYRSNILLISGEHYSKRNTNLFRQIRSNRELNDQNKIRLTRNHSQRIQKSFCNHILSQAPWVGPNPKNKKELQDQKAAELNNAVWLDARARLDLDEKIDSWCDDFVGIGEVATKVFWDPNAGYIVGYEQKMDPETGGPMVDEMGQPIPDDSKPKYSGDMVFEDVYGFNLLRDSCAKKMKESPYLIIRKMMDVSELKAKFADKEDLIHASNDDTFVVFDTQKGGYRNSKDEVLVKEYWFRPCFLYPRGYYYIDTKEGTLDEGELPGGIFPIVTGGFEYYQTAPRGHGPIETFKPYQVELNRMASKIAEHQITIGDDKLLHQSGTKISNSVQFPGIRALQYTGGAPTFLEGRSGAQFLEVYNSTLTEGYGALGMKEDLVEDPENGATDPYGLLFKAARQKVRYKRNVKRFERYLKEVCRTFLELAKIHLPDDAFVQEVGKSEAINIQEFKNTTPLCYQIEIEPQSEDMETKMGRQLVMNHVLQYVGNKLEKEDVGKIIRQMPYANVEEALSDFTMDFDLATNILLALDRGQKPQPHPDDPHVYINKRLSSRMQQADFQFLSPEIQKNYALLREMHSTMETIRLQQIKAMESDFIPSGGFLVACDFYAPKPDDPSKTQRVRIPSEAIQWLITQLESQGSALGDLENAGAPTQSAVASAYLQKNPSGGPVTENTGMPMQTEGNNSNGRLGNGST